MIRHTKGHAQLDAEACVAGQRNYATLVEGRSNRWVLALVKATVTTTVALTSVLGLGSALQVFDQMGLDENGKDMAMHPMFLLLISEFLRGSAATATRLTSVGTGTYNLVEQVILPFEYLYGAKPRETHFRERNPSARTRFFYNLNGTNNGLGNIGNGGTATVTLVSVEVLQFFDDDPTAGDPLFKPQWREVTLPIPSSSANWKMQIDLAPDEILRGVSIMQNTNNRSIVGDIINKVRFAGSRQDIIGRGGLVNYDGWARSQEFEAGGNVYATPNKSLVHYNFQKSGRLAQCLNSQQDAQFAFYFDAQPSSVAGATGSEIRVLLHLLKRDPYHRQDGSYVCAPQLPAYLAN